MTIDRCLQSQIEGCDVKLLTRTVFILLLTYSMTSVGNAGMVGKYKLTHLILAFVLWIVDVKHLFFYHLHV